MVDVAFTTIEREEVGFILQYYAGGVAHLGHIVEYVGLRRKNLVTAEMTSPNPLVGGYKRMVSDVGSWIEAFVDFRICASELRARYPHPFVSRIIPGLQLRARRLRENSAAGPIATERLTC